MPDEPANDPSVEVDRPPAWPDLIHQFGREVDRVADRLRNLSAARLAAPAPPHPSRAAAARAAAQALADFAAGLAAGGTEPARRSMPELVDFSVGDQVAVAGHDLVAAAEGVAEDRATWGHHGRRTAREVLQEAAEALAILRGHL